MLRAFARYTGNDHPGGTERRIALLRLVILFALMPLLWWDVVEPQTEVVLIGLTALIAAYILAALLLLPRLRGELRKDLFLTIDILAVTALAWYTGGINSSLLFLFYLPLLSAALRLDLLQAMLSAIAVSGIVAWMWVASVGSLAALGATTLRMAAFIGSSLLFALVFGMLAHETRVLRDRAEMNRRLHERLEEATGQLRRRLGELEFAYDLVRRLAATADSAAVMALAADAARQLLQAPYAGVFLADQMGAELMPGHLTGIGEQEAEPMMRRCAEATSRDRPDPVTVEAPAGGAWRRAVCAPLVAGERLLGVLCAGGDGLWEPARHSVAALGQIAYQAGIALDRASLLETLERLAMAKPEAHVFDRRQFERILRAEIGRATQVAAPFALLRLALWDLASGAVGDEQKADLAHRRFAYLVLKTVRRADVIAQVARGEIAVLLSMANLAAAEKFVARLLDEVQVDAALTGLLGGTGPVDVRVGIAMFPEDAVTAAELAFAAQNALDSTDAARRLVRAGELDALHAAPRSPQGSTPPATPAPPAAPDVTPSRRSGPP